MTSHYTLECTAKSIGFCHFIAILEGASGTFMTKFRRLCPGAGAAAASCGVSVCVPRLLPSSCLVLLSSVLSVCGLACGPSYCSLFVMPFPKKRRRRRPESARPTTRPEVVTLLLLLCQV